MSSLISALTAADRDLATYSNYRQVRSDSIHLGWSIDWSAQTVGGSVTHEMIVLEGGEGLEDVVLDTRDLEITKVEVDGKEAKYEVKSRHEVLGSALHVALPQVYKPSSKFNLTIAYSTTKDCSALGWLTAEQTSGGSHPYLYSQSQAIHARSLLPSQDTPSVKSTYTASIKSSLPVLMSAKRISPPPEKVIKPGKEVEYKFEQGVRIPSYLIAIAAGNLVYKAFDASVSHGRWTSGVWTEPELIDSAFWEFSEDTAKFVNTAEVITGSPYAWGVYDVLVLPPSFPYGGMENPDLTFATPTLLAGDRSLVDVVAHEISHSWFGNLIGCASWSHFWLNEGWTTYLERLLVQEVRGPAARGLSYIIGAKALQESLDEYEEKGQGRFQRLVVKYEEGEDPDDAFSSIPYNKGANLILHLEQTLGGLEAFKTYIASYVSTFAGQSITTEQWKSHLYSFWRKHGGDDAIRKLDSVKWDEWLNGEGTNLPVEMKYDTSLADSAYDLASRWHQAGSDPSRLAIFNSTDLDSFGAEQTMVFLERLQSYKKISPEAVRRMDEVYAFAKSKNAELSFRFLTIALMSGTEYAEQAASWVADKGRMKFCRSIYKSLFSVAPELARKTFLAHSAFYHPIAARMIKKDLGLAGSA